MSDSRLGRRYADGLYEAAKKQDTVEEVYAALKSIQEAFDNIPELTKFWRSYQTTLSQKKAMVEAAFKEAPELVRNLFFILIDKKRESILHDVFVAFANRYDEELGIIRAVLTTAVKLDDNEINPFIDYLKGRFGGEVDLKHQLDPSMIAGFRLRYGNRIIDASVERSINEIRRRVSA
ncbi:MAG: ATP synthase F1 subunit delta [Candidatus Electryonea clarkiae]|nr:ATP synthase F1 subunit delta [Candidatus Electryonea clarkiae]MDP8286312.1 ATP synthase F1 subunit delta [Candidatus Electryonea clarkiae]